jgi:hypothetical protein
VGQDVAAVGDAQRQVNVLFHEQHARPAAGRVLPHHRKEPADDDRSQAEAHLVEHQQFRLAGQGAGDREHLLLAAREQPRLPLLQLPQRRKMRERGVHLRRSTRAVEAEVLGHGQPEEDAAIVRDVRDAEERAGRRVDAVQVGVCQADRAGRRLQQAGYRPQGSGLPGPVRAEQRDHLPRAHGEAQVPDDRRRPSVGDAQPVEFQHHSTRVSRGREERIGARRQFPRRRYVPSGHLTRL